MKTKIKPKFKKGDVVRHLGIPGSVYLVEDVAFNGKTCKYLMKKLYSTIGFHRAWDYDEDRYTHVSTLERELW